MNPTTSGDSPPAPLPWWGALHRALMPDYNRKATAYWCLMVLLGIVTLAVSAVQLAAQAPVAWVQTAVGTTIAVLAAFFPVRVRRSTNSLAAGEIFIFLLLLIHGPGAAAIAAAGEGFVGSYRTSKRWTSRIVSPAMAAVSMYAVGAVFEVASDRLATNAGALILAAMLFGLGYFVCNTLMVTAVPRLKRNEALQWSDLFGVFGWIGIAYAGSAAVSALLYLTYRQSGVGVLMAMVPLLAMMGALFNSMAGAQMQHIPYKGSGPAIVDLLGGQIEAVFSPLVDVVPHVRSGKLKAIGITTKARSAVFPEVPAIIEQLPGYEVVLWNGILVPAKTPQDVVNKLNAALNRILTQPETKQLLAEQGSEPAPSTQVQFRDFIGSEIVRWRKLVEISGATALD